MYYVYMLRCEDNTLYTGISSDWKRRLAEHMEQGRRCAKYTRSHKVVSLEALWQTEDKASALKAERKIKQLSKENKEKIIKTPQSIYDLLKDIDFKLDICRFNSLK